MKPTVHHETHRHSLIPTALLAAFIGFFAGIVGMLVTVASLPSSAGVSMGTSLLHAAPTPPASGLEEPAIIAAAKTVAFLAPIKTSGSSLVDKSYLPSEVTGAASVLTSDGWLLTFDDSTSTKTPAKVALIGAMNYPITETVTDPLTGASFEKINATSLSVSAFAESDAVVAGDAVFALDAAGGAHWLDVLSVDQAPAQNAIDAIRSSERLGKVFLLSSAENMLPGAPVFDRKGELVAIYAHNLASGSIAIPLSSVMSVMGSVLRDQRIARPVLGVHVADLAHLLGFQNLNGGGVSATRGAFLVSSADGKSPAVIKGSPAEGAGLLAGDIITAVGQEELTAKVGLADLVAEYQPGTSITLSVLRGDKQLQLEVVLGSQISSKH